MTLTRLTIILAALAGLFFLVPGIWAFADPKGFYDNVAEFPPYNKHFVHDIGAFQIGIGVALLAACVRADALACTTLGAGTGSGIHTIAHLMDHHLGGSAGQTTMFAIVTIVLLAIAAIRLAPGLAHRLEQMS